MHQFNPPHPGELIQSTYLSTLNISSNKLAKHLKVSSGTVSRLLNCRTSLSVDMALKLSVVLGGSPESWLQIQRNYDLWHARLKFDPEGYEQLYMHSELGSVDTDLHDKTEMMRNKQKIFTPEP